MFLSEGRGCPKTLRQWENRYGIEQISWVD